MSGAEARARAIACLVAREGGAVRFDRWMEEALYHPQAGYYAAGIRTVGRRGDFTTMPQIDASLARGILRWAAGRRGGLIEIGPGSGALARAVLRGLPLWRLLHLAERSPVLRATQQRLLGRRAAWHEGPAEALAALRGRAWMFANELVDAFPCRVFRRAGPGWDELHIGLDGGRAIEVWRRADELPDSTVFEHEWPDGQRVEVHVSFRDWLAGWLPGWREGRLLLIDYGGTGPGLYARRPMGTLRAYAFHQRIEGREVLDGFGRRDLTADVNFADLARWARQLALEVAAPVTLAAWLAGDLPPALREAAGAFLVLECRRSQRSLPLPSGAPPKVEDTRCPAPQAQNAIAQANSSDLPRLARAS